MKRVLLSFIVTGFLLSAGNAYGQTNWTVQTSGTSSALLSVTWTGSLLVTVGWGGTILTSPDGVTWTPQTSGTTRRLLCVSWCGGQVIAVGENGTILTSPDGITWTSQTSGTTRLLNRVAWNGTMYITLGSIYTSTTPPIILTSPDGITWTTRYTSSILWNLFSIAMNDSMNIIVGTHSTYEGSVILTSPDGITWTEQTSPTIVDSSSGLYDVIWTGTSFVAVGGRCHILTSPDGFAWTRHRWTWAGVTGGYLNSIAGNGNMLATVGTINLSGIIATSLDGGVTWTPRTGGGNGLVKWLGNIFLDVGSGGHISTSSDGITWTGRTSGTTNYLYDIFFTGNLYVVVGNGGTILTSPLDPAGTLPSHNTNPKLLFLKYSGGMFSYILPSREFVELGIYSISGKRVAVLEKGYQSAGDHNAGFNVGALPVGTYVYRFKAGNCEAGGKVMVTR